MTKTMRPQPRIDHPLTGDQLRATRGAALADVGALTIEFEKGGKLPTQTDRDVK